MSVPVERRQQQIEEESGLTEEERLQRIQQRIDVGIVEIIGTDDGKPTLDDFLNDPDLQGKFADDEVQKIFQEIEEDPARIADYKDNDKVKEVLKRICEIFEPHVNQQNQQNPQHGGPEDNIQNMYGGQGNPELIAQQPMGGGNQNPFAQLYQGQEENPLANLAQLFGGQGGNPMENLGQLFQGQGQNPMAHFAQLFGDQGQGDAQLNEEQLAYLQEYLRNMA